MDDLPLRYGCLLMPRDLARTREAARLAEAGGLDWFGLGDSPAVFEDVALHLAEAARVTSRISLGPIATHVVIRHPLVVANQLATLAELSGDRVVAAVATGNSAARGLGLPPATRAQLAEALSLMRGYWRGEGGTYGRSTVPGSSIRRADVPLFVAGDGPLGMRLGAELGDGVLYSGSLEPSVLTRRVAVALEGPGRAGGPGEPWSRAHQCWVAAACSVNAPGEAARELGPALVAIANRALRGDLTERGIPEALQADVAAMRNEYDYAAHGTYERPRNREVMSAALAEHLLGSFCITGDEQAWRDRLVALRNAGVDGVVFIVNQAEELATLAAVIERLHRLEGTRPVR
ncbi:MAG: LLM class flavin-dependent oxidoreductase [Acidimicrobiia bacterium]